jgi:ABC-type antimicrobial peptide transport system permease subunit
MHVFFMLIYERQRELGIMRAVGATRGDIRVIILGQAGLVGLTAGSIGIGLAFAFTRVFDFVSNRYLPDFPYKPETYFDFSLPIVLGALAFAVGFCVLGAALPAGRAARLDPAAVLTGR